LPLTDLLWDGLRDHRLGAYLRDMRAHMPPAHRAFLASLCAPAAGSCSAAGSSGGGGVRGMCAGAASSSALRDAYNEAVQQLTRFRAQHRAFAAAYITAPAEKEARAAGRAATKGTGGTEFGPALAGYQRTTKAHVLEQSADSLQR
jgi:indoleamine 2,3-dioxygenase